jgi:hypothetical protein
MADSNSERRRRRPKRAGAYAVVVTACAVVALASAWQAAHPISARLLWQERSTGAFGGKVRDGASVAP